MPANNNSLFNAALSAFVSGVEFERVISSGVASSYAGVRDAGVAFATEVDSLIPVDVAMNASKADLLGYICSSQVDGRYPISAIPADYLFQATAIAALYAEIAPSLTVPQASSPPLPGAMANFFALMPGDNAATIAAGAPVNFPQNGPTLGGAATRASANTFTLPATGTYRVVAQVSVSEPGQLQLAIGGVGLPNTVVGRATGTSQITINTLIAATAGQILSVINPAGNVAALTITPIAGGTHSVSATLTIEQVG